MKSLLILIALTFAAAPLAAQETTKSAPKQAMQVAKTLVAQTVCPISGEELDAEEAFAIEGFNAGACCPKCVGKAEADLVTFFAELEERNMVVEYASTDCLVMPGKPVNRSHFATLGAKRYFFCCEPCTMTFMKNSEKFWAGDATAAGMEASVECAGWADGKECADCN